MIWLQDFIHLFNSSKGYLNTGTLFFRDRLTQTKNRLTLTSGSVILINSKEPFSNADSSIGMHNADKLFKHIRSIANQMQKQYGTNARYLVEGNDTLDTVLYNTTASTYRRFLTAISFSTVYIHSFCGSTDFLKVN